MPPFPPTFAFQIDFRNLLIEYLEHEALSASEFNPFTHRTRTCPPTRRAWSRNRRRESEVTRSGVASPSSAFVLLRGPQFVGIRVRVHEKQRLSAGSRSFGLLPCLGEPARWIVNADPCPITECTDIGNLWECPGSCGESSPRARDSFTAMSRNRDSTRSKGSVTLINK